MLEFNLVSNGKSLPASFAFQATEWIRRRSADAKIITHFKRSCNNVAINSYFTAVTLFAYSRIVLTLLIQLGSNQNRFTAPKSFNIFLFYLGALGLSVVKNYLLMDCNYAYSGMSI